MMFLGTIKWTYEAAISLLGGFFFFKCSVCLYCDWTFHVDCSSSCPRVGSNICHRSQKQVKRVVELNQCSAKMYPKSDSGLWREVRLHVNNLLSFSRVFAQTQTFYMNLCSFMGQPLYCPSNVFVLPSLAKETLCNVIDCNYFCFWQTTLVSIWLKIN